MARWQDVGTASALLSAFFLGMAPIFGKLAITRGMAPLGVAAWRTVLATLLLYLVLRWRRPEWLYIHRIGLAGCLLAGVINGTGSLFYYSALGRIDASLGQLLYSLYPVFVGLWLLLDGQTPGRMTWVRLALAVPAVYLLTAGGARGPLDWGGVAMMLMASALYALHLPVNQRVLYEAPSPTVTLYTLAAMSGVVVVAYLFSGTWQVPASPELGVPVLALTLVTFLSRLTLFMGVKRIGGMQTALLGLAELMVTVLFAHWWLGESLTPKQWLGAALLLAVLLLNRWDRPAAPPRPGRGGWLRWLEPPSFQV